MNLKANSILFRFSAVFGSILDKTISFENQRINATEQEYTRNILRRKISSWLVALIVIFVTQPLDVLRAQSNSTDNAAVRTVEVEGMAAGDSGNARAEALTAALREAVRVGVGVNVVEQTQVSDFQLDFDKVFAQSFGYVRNYKVLATNLGEDGIYRVRINAQVSPGNPADNDRMTFKMLARSRQSPRLMIQLVEEINGKTGSSTAADWYGNLARELGVQVSYSQPNQANMASRRAEILERGKESSLRQAGVVSTHDYLLEGKIVANSSDLQPIAGTQRRMCSVSVELRIVDPIAGKVVVSDVMEVRRFALEASLDPAVACREAIRRSLSEAATVDSKAEPRMKVMRMLFCHWIAEMDLGAVFRIELAGLELDSAESLRSGLAGQDKIGAVWVRSVDPAGVSVVEVESRLDGLDLARVLRKASGDAYVLDRSDNRYLSMVRSTSSSSADQASVNSDSEKSKIPWFAILGISALAFVIFGLLIKKLITQKTSHENHNS